MMRLVEQWKLGFLSTILFGNTDIVVQHEEVYLLHNIQIKFKTIFVSISGY